MAPGDSDISGNTIRFCRESWEGGGSPVAVGFRNNPLGAKALKEGSGFLAALAGCGKL
jgi:hypothetical protein